MVQVTELDWSRDLGGMSVGPVCSQSRNSSLFSSAICLNSVRHSFPEWKPKHTWFQRFSSRQPAVLSFLFRASVCTPIKDQAKSEAAYIKWALSICACVLFYFELTVQGSIQEAKYTVIYEALPRCGTVVFTHIPKCACTIYTFFISVTPSLLSTSLSPHYHINITPHYHLNITSISPHYHLSITSLSPPSNSFKVYLAKLFPHTIIIKKWLAKARGWATKGCVNLLQLMTSFYISVWGWVSRSCRLNVNILLMYPQFAYSLPHKIRSAWWLLQF